MAEAGELSHEGSYTQVPQWLYVCTAAGCPPCLSSTPTTRSTSLNWRPRQARQGKRYAELIFRFFPFAGAPARVPWIRRWVPAPPRRAEVCSPRFPLLAHYAMPLDLPPSPHPAAYSASRFSSCYIGLLGTVALCRFVTSSRSGSSSSSTQRQSFRRRPSASGIGGLGRVARVGLVRGVRGVCSMGAWRRLDLVATATRRQGHRYTSSRTPERGSYGRSLALATTTAEPGPSMSTLPVPRARTRRGLRAFAPCGARGW